VQEAVSRCGLICNPNAGAIIKVSIVTDFNEANAISYKINDVNDIVMASVVTSSVQPDDFQNGNIIT